MRIRPTIIGASLVLALLLQQTSNAQQDYAGPSVFSSKTFASNIGLIRGQDSEQPAAACGSECVDACCLRACYSPTWRLFGEFLYIRPRDAEVVYAVPIEGPIVPPPSNNPIQIGPTAIVDPQYEQGFRVGFSRAMDDCSSLMATYTRFESRTTDQTSIDAPNVIRSMVAHPSSASAATDFLDASALYDLNFQLADLDYRRVFSCGERHSLAYLVGVRYAHLEQDFSSQFSNLGTETVTTDINFDGGGIRFGLEGERHAAKPGLMAYGRGGASFLGGEFQGNYLQSTSTDPLVVSTSWKAGRVVTILDLELGLGWTSCKGCFRATAGYMVSAWLNTPKTEDFIRAVQNNDFGTLGGSEAGRLTFDGPTARVELRY